MTAAADAIKAETKGEAEVQVFPSGQLGNDTHMLSDVRSGAIQMMGVGDNILTMRLADTPGARSRPAPELGEDNEAVLGMLGVTPSALAGLRERGLI